jgi:hypothetical protein
MLNLLVDFFTVVSDLEIISSESQIFQRSFDRCPRKSQREHISCGNQKSGSAMELDNYRGITLTSNVYKVFSKILEECIMSHLEETPTAFPLARFFKEVSIDARENLNENISVVETKFSSNLATLFLTLSLKLSTKRWSRVLSVEGKRLLKCGMFIENVPLRKIKVAVSGVSSR